MKNEKQQLWNQLLTASDEGRVACHLYLARLYTRRYQQDAGGWLLLGDGLTQIARYDEARDALRIALRNCPARRQHLIHCYLGHMYDKKGRLPLAEKWYRRAIEGQPSTRYLIFLGGCLARQGQYAEAKRCHRRAIRLASDIPDEAWFNLGLILRAQNRYKDALECFNKALELDPEYKNANNAKEDVLALLRLKGRLSSSSKCNDNQNLHPRR